MVALADTRLSSNVASQKGGSIYANSMEGWSILDIRDTEISDNSAGTEGGGIYILNGYVFVMRTQLINNTASSGGAIYTHNEFMDIAITESTFLNNTATLEGGAILNDAGSTNTLHDSCLSGNTAAGGSSVSSITPDFDATGNWWGAADGPSGAGSGTGDAVNANVLFTPFLAEGCPLNN